MQTAECGSLHPFLIIVYHVLANSQDYQELGATYFDELNRDKKE